MNEFLFHQLCEFHEFREFFSKFLFHFIGFTKLLNLMNFPPMKIFHKLKVLYLIFIYVLY